MEFWALPTGARASTPEATTGASGTFNQRYAIFPVNDGGGAHAGSGVSVGTNGISVFEQAASYLPSLLVYNAAISGWTHVAVVYSNRQPALYVNGVAVRTGLTSTHSSSPSTVLGESGYGFGYYAGLLDEVSIYGRALSGAEIQSIYNAGSGGKCESSPVITAEPTNESVIVGTTASFSVGAGGTQPLTYQWLLNNNPILSTSNSTATNATLILSDVQLPQNGGLYSVLVSNAAGSTNSSNALLTVNLPPPCEVRTSWAGRLVEGEGNAHDTSGTNNGILVGGVSFTNGESERAFSFDGATGYVTSPVYLFEQCE